MRNVQIQKSSKVAYYPGGGWICHKVWGNMPQAMKCELITQILENQQYFKLFKLLVTNNKYLNSMKRKINLKK